MHNNYYFLKKLSEVLGERLANMAFLTCFSQEKNELVMGFSHGREEFFLKAVLNPEFCCLTFPESFSRARRNSVDLFKEALGHKVIRVQQYLNERCFAIHLESGFSLLFKMHGNRSNIVLFQENKVIFIFRNNLKKDHSLDLTTLDRPIDQDYDAFIKAGCQPDTLFPTFGKILRGYLGTKSFPELPCDARWETIKSTLVQLDSNEFYISKLGTDLVLSLVSIGEVMFRHNHPVEAINHFYQIHSGSFYLEKEKGIYLKTLERKLSQSQSYLQKSLLKFNELKNNARNEELANIIMANLHQFNVGSGTYEVFDFYRNEPVQIVLKRGFTPQKLAENFYRKAKNQKLEVNQLQENIQAKETLIETLNRDIDAIAVIDNMKGLRNYVKENNIVGENKEAEEVLPYKEVIFEGYTILVGKNARSNDLLIQTYAKKDDLWLHAKDSSGSHVVIKQKPGHNFPKNVIERAAELAAYHSKQRTDSFCPVIYTPRKYVRKIKGGPPGAVRLEKESVILVKPKI